MRYQGHALDEITLDGTFKEAREAAVNAAVTGSQGSTLTHSRNGVEDWSFTVEAIKQVEERNRSWHQQTGEAWSWGPAYRVEGLDVVIVLAGAPGRYTSHALSELEQAIKDELDEADQAAADLDEPYDPEEDYLRSLIHNEDI